ncbi:hypothetical protein QZH41_018864, partial [Actinostola sp. cb2023]
SVLLFTPKYCTFRDEMPAEEYEVVKCFYEKNRGNSMTKDVNKVESLLGVLTIVGLSTTSMVNTWKDDMPTWRHKFSISKEFNSRYVFRGNSSIIKSFLANCEN